MRESSFLENIIIPICFDKQFGSDKLPHPNPLPVEEGSYGKAVTGEGIKTKENYDNFLEKLHGKISQDILENPKALQLLAFIFAYSPFLSGLVIRNGDFFADICRGGADKVFAKLKHDLREFKPASAGDLMQKMRIAKGQAALLIALADIGKIWQLEKVTEAMSEFAEICVGLTLNFLLKKLGEKGDIILKSSDNPQAESGIFVLAMGKLGAYELNYSSDIDLIIFFDSEKVNYVGNQNINLCFSKLAHELVRMLQERTPQGYVFRTDLRLRPDPSSTPAAMSTSGAITYYETVGQNWERAAFIKARPIAGDMEAAEQFFAQIKPFIWRKNLDFAAIADIQSIKRQMDAKSGKKINIAGHNIKTGIGGIREIEFFAQIHQLIWGGRILDLRSRATCKTLQILADEGLIEYEIYKKLVDAYRFFREVEHRLQMVDDQQTHIIPIDEIERKKVIKFIGFEDQEQFERELSEKLEFVHKIFSESFRGEQSLGSDEGELSFTGVEHNPQTIETLAKMGYHNPESVCEVIHSWHRGARRATRTKRARELITELTPTLLKALAGNLQPDHTFMLFDEFLSKLPAGVQLFSLFQANPQLLDLIATIMGSAPSMAEVLSKNPNLLDTVLTTDFYDKLPDKNVLETELNLLLSQARDFEDQMIIIRRFKNEKKFQAGVLLIHRQITPLQSSFYLSDIAEVSLQAMLFKVEENFALKYPEYQPGGLALLALGRLGAAEMTFSSDVDLIFVYASDDADIGNNHILYNKLSQRVINAAMALSSQGSLYTIDTRMRPSGKDGALAVSTQAFEKYLSESAWNFELMALTRSRVIEGNKQLAGQVESIVKNRLMLACDETKLQQDIVDLRKKITKELGSDDIWNLKYVHGGLLDLDFIAQYFVLLHSDKYPDLIGNSSHEVFDKIIEYKIISGEIGEKLQIAHRYLSSLFLLIRLCGGDKFNPDSSPPGLRKLLVESLKLANFAEVKDNLISTLNFVKQYSFFYDNL